MYIHNQILILNFFCDFVVIFTDVRTSLIPCGLSRDKAVKYLRATTNRCLNLIADKVLFATSWHNFLCSLINNSMHSVKSVNAK